MVRIICFEDRTRWIARLRMPARTPISGEKSIQDANDALLLQREVDCLMLVKEQTSIPVPEVYGYMASPDNEIGAPFMLMECLNGNVALDLNFNHIPEEYKDKFFEAMAKIQVCSVGSLSTRLGPMDADIFQTEISSIRFPKIGALVRRKDGGYDVGPLPGIGGPFATATEYFQAWATNVRYPRSESYIRAACGPHAEEVLSTTTAFPLEISRCANRLAAIADRGPFPLCHVDFGHNNIIVDNEYNILGVIDWEHAFSSPWETTYFPLILQVIPPAIDAPDNYDTDGRPKDVAARAKLIDRVIYLNAIRKYEALSQDESNLSKVLSQPAIERVAAAMRLFEEGKLGLFSKVLTDLETATVKLEEKS